MYTMFHYFSPFSLYFGSFVWRPLFKFRAESYKKSRMCRGILGDGAISFAFSAIDSNKDNNNDNKLYWLRRKHYLEDI